MALESSLSAAARSPDCERLVADYYASLARCEAAQLELTAAQRELQAITALVGGESTGLDSDGQLHFLTANAKLSGRERAVFELIGRGYATHEIADRLKLAVSTIETYRERLKDKLKINSAVKLTQQAVLWVMKHELQSGRHSGTPPNQTA